MGRPLFSESYTRPAVHSDSEPSTPGAISYEKWTHWNAFDPDSDEFFERDDAVYEAFLDPADVARMRADTRSEAAREGGESAPSRRVQSLQDFIERDLADSGDDYSSSSSEGTVSGRGSPMAVGSDDATGMGGLADAYRAAESEPSRVVIDLDGARRNQTPSNRVRRSFGTSTSYVVRDNGTVRIIISHSPNQGRGFIPPENSPPLSSPPPLEEHFDVPDLVERPETPPHRHIPAHRTPIYERELQRTPSPSPAPHVTPRLYSWSSRTPFGRAQLASPTPLHRHQQGPLTNPSARMSHPHLSPAPVVVRMA